MAELHQMDASLFWRLAWAGDFRALVSVAVTDLGPRDFSVFEDGKQQVIERVRAQLQGDSPIITDNLGQYRESASVGGGTWAVPLWENNRPYRRVIEGPPLPGCLLTYAPPSSPDGSCHHVSVSIDRPESLILSREEYCDARQAATDPLKGTRLGEEMQADVESNKSNQISMSLGAIPLLTSEGATRVRIVLEYSSKFVVGNCLKPKRVGIQGMLHGSDGLSAVTFSDVTERSYGHTFANGKAWMILSEGFSGPCSLFAPFRYETQLEVPPGKYKLRVGLMDLNRFGEVEVPVTVDNDNGTQLETSGIVLAKRFRDAVQGSPTELPGTITPLVAKGIQVTPAADTRFKKGDAFYFYFQVYQPQSSGTAEPKVDAHLRIVDSATGKLVWELDPDIASYHTPGSRLIPVLGTIDVAALPTSSYQLQLQATDSSGNVTPWHTASFTVEP